MLSSHFFSGGFIPGCALALVLCLGERDEIFTYIYTYMKGERRKEMQRGGRESARKKYGRGRRIMMT